MIRLSRYTDVAEALRARELRQSLYDAGSALMGPVIVNLHGDEHRDRRRMENRLFRRDVFAAWERDLLGPTVEEVLAPAIAAGEADVLRLGRVAMMTVSRRVAGVDLPDDTQATFDAFAELMRRMATAAVVVHTTRPAEEVIADGNAALAEFEQRFFVPSRERRQLLIDEVAAGRADPDGLPRDVLSVLLHNQDRLALSHDEVLRETAYYPWVGAHSTSNALVFAVDEILGWLERQSTTPDANDSASWAACVHESLRLHPASPEARRQAVEPVVLSSGVAITAGDDLVLEMAAANRDRDVFGDDADEFRPGRSLPPRVAPWGLSFGTGTHACLGQALAGGSVGDEHLHPGETSPMLGAITLMVQALLRHGLRRHPTRTPERDRHTTRPNFASYWVALGP